MGLSPLLFLTVVLVVLQSGFDRDHNRFVPPKLRLVLIADQRFRREKRLWPTGTAEREGKALRFELLGEKR
jgi:hypothetical protein